MSDYSNIIEDAKLIHAKVITLIEENCKLKGNEQETEEILFELNKKIDDLAAKNITLVNENKLLSEQMKNTQILLAGSEEEKKKAYFELNELKREFDNFKNNNVVIEVSERNTIKNQLQSIISDIDSIIEN